MKRSFFGPLLLATVLFLGFTACKKNNSSNSSNNNNTNTTLPTTTWKVTYFYDDKDETAHFTGYSFDFFTNGSVTATQGAQTINGSWTDGNDDSTTKLYLNFGTASPFDELNEDWEILSISDTKIELRHISGGNGGTDLLTFEKI